MKLGQMTNRRSCSIGITVSGWMGWLGFLCTIGEKPFLVPLVDQPFQPASNRVEKAFA